MIFLLNNLDSKETFTNFALLSFNSFSMIEDNDYEKGKEDLVAMLDSLRLIQDRGQRKTFKTLLRAMFYELTKD